MISLTFLPVRLTVSWIEALKKVELSDSDKYYFSEEKLHFFHSFMWYLIEKLIQVWEKENICENCTIFKSISNQISLCDRVPIQTLKTGSNLKKLIEQQKNNKSRKKYFLTFPACFSIPIFFSNLNSNCSNLLDWEISRNKLKKHSVTKNCSDLSLFEQIVLVISKCLQILGLHSRISRFFLDH